jgi:hypothetical protein
MKKSSKLASKKISVILIILAALAFCTAIYLIVSPSATATARKNRIESIYSSLHINTDTYLLQKEDVFGEKKVYPYDKGRSYSSSKQYIHADTVDATVNELKKSIINAGFSYTGEPYPGATFKELHFKSNKDEYLRLNVSSKPRDDTIQNTALMKKELTSVQLGLDANAGPANVTIKVNLDDNNE